ncbi:hypothetical protein NPIL_435471 [Nephila pilipes]|uniref:Uncharacterized protein n=1 Tax=Nephila pilipes TaxID=299642 RepID=A0A8X6QRZ8_NEPPI|nr:hypothetical protein NPIL_435471 [Nephila pilipes]
MQLGTSTEPLPPNTIKSVVSNVIYFNTKAGAAQKPLETTGGLPILSAVAMATPKRIKHVNFCHWPYKGLEGNLRSFQTILGVISGKARLKVRL